MKKTLIIVVATILCLAVIGGVFALYSTAPQDRVISISTSGAASLTISGFTAGEGDLIKPGTSITKQIVLDDTVTDSLTGTATLTATIANKAEGALAQYLSVSFIETNSSYGELENATETTISTTGATFTLSNLPHYGILTITCTCTDEQFKAVSKDQVEITLNFDYNDFVPVDQTWYLIGSATDWLINERAIALTDSNGTDRAAKLNVNLVTGDWKAVQYIASTYATDGNYINMPWSNNGNIAVTAGNKNVYVGSDWGLYITDAQ